MSPDRIVEIIIEQYLYFYIVISEWDFSKSSWYQLMPHQENKSFDNIAKYQPKKTVGFI